MSELQQIFPGSVQTSLPPYGVVIFVIFMSNPLFPYHFLPNFSTVVIKSITKLLITISSGSSSDLHDSLELEKNYFEKMKLPSHTIIKEDVTLPFIIIFISLIHFEG